MVIYTMTNDLLVNGEVKRCMHRLYFDKYEIAIFLKNIPFTKEYVNMFEVPPERIATKDTVHKIMKRVIYKTNCSRERLVFAFRLHDYIMVIGMIAMMPILLFRKIYAFIRTYNRPYHCSQIEGYSPYLPLNYTLEEAVKLYEEQLKHIDYKKYNLKELQFKDLLALYFDIFNLTNYEIGKLLYVPSTSKLSHETIEKYGYRGIQRGRILYEQNKGILNILRNY